MVNGRRRFYNLLVSAHTSDLEFRLLGPIEVRSSGEPLPLGDPKQRALLALLLVEAGRAVSTDRIVDALWGEHPPRTAQTSLQNFVSQLRKLLGPEVLVTKPPGYLLRARPDAERVRELVAEARAAASPDDRAAKLREAFERARSVLVDELGIDPSPRLQQLHKAILRQEVRLEPARAAPAQDHFEDVAATILAGRVVPVLGTDVAELTLRLAQRFGYPGEGGAVTLPRGAQYVAVMKGSGPLYDELHDLLDADLPPTAVHRFFASLPPLLRERGLPHQLLVTTSYDNALERAFHEAGEELDVVAYLASGRNRGLFCHIGPGGQGSLVDQPNTYATELSLERRTVVLKLHGQVERTPTREWESFVVTEDDYIGYLARTDIAGAVPVALAATLRRSHFLFLGYTMADWNLRVILHRLWGDEPLRYHSWAVQPEPKPLECEFWRRRDVDVVELSFEQYTETVARYLAAQPAEAAR